MITHKEWKEDKKKHDVPDGRCDKVNVGEVLETFHKSKQADSDLAKLEKAVKEADPSAIVIGGAVDGNVQWTERLVELGGLQYMDVLSIHLAVTAQTPGIVSPEVLAALPAGAIVLNTARAEVIDEYFGTNGHRGYEDRVYRNFAEFYLSKRRYNDAATVWTKASTCC